MIKFHQKIGLLGGTFDPVHLGHLHMAHSVQQALGFMQVQFIPCHTPVHKPALFTTPADRLEMLRLAAAPYSGLSVNDIEIVRGGLSYTYDTLVALKKKYPHVALTLILGDEAFDQTPEWERWPQCLQLVNVLVVTRNREPKVQFPEATSNSLSTNLNGLISYYFFQPLPISSTYIRFLCHKKEPIDRFVPQTVADYITQHGLYLEEHLTNS